MVNRWLVVALPAIDLRSALRCVALRCVVLRCVSFCFVVCVRSLRSLVVDDLQLESCSEVLDLNAGWFVHGFARDNSLPEGCPPPQPPPPHVGENFAKSLLIFV